MQPNGLASTLDQQVAIWVFCQVRKVMLSAALVPVVLDEAYPGFTAQSNTDILNVIQVVAHPIYQALGTCAMKACADGGIVIAQLRVYGTANLCIVDTSIFPIMPSASCTVIDSLQLGLDGF